MQAFNDSWREETQNRRRIITVQSQQILVMPHHRHIREVGTSMISIAFAEDGTNCDEMVRAGTQLYQR